MAFVALYDANVLYPGSLLDQGTHRFQPWGEAWPEFIAELAAAREAMGGLARQVRILLPPG